MSSSSKGISAGIFGILAVSLTFGAVQLASGRDLAGFVRAPSATTAVTVNRTTKTDREASASIVPGERTRTISLRFDSLPDTTVLVRLPLAQEARNVPAHRSLMRSPDSKATVACEPVVSVLTEVAKRLQPGRCIT
jgi:hypothetical protein